MPDTSGKQLSMDAAQNPDRKPAVRLAGVGKEYRLYKSFSDQALDVLGLSWMRFWKPLRYQTFTALNGIDLEIKHGERVGIIGRNGAGKTTLLKLVTGNFAPTAGEIEINGNVQALMQTGLGFHGDFTGRENVKSSLIYNGLMGDELEAAAEDVMEFCELGEFFDQPVKTYSLGMRARLQFACATAIKPDIVIIDEVLGAGDAYFSVKSAERMEKLASSGCTMLLVSHSMGQVIQFCDRAIWIRDGRIVDDGDVREVVGDYEVYCSGLTENIESERKLVAKYAENAQKSGGFKVKLDDGTDVHRWASATGVKLAGFELTVDGARTHDLQSLSPAACRMRLICETDGQFKCRYLVSISTTTGTRVTRFESGVDRFMARQGDVREVAFNINPLRLGPGNYFVNASVFEAVDATATGKRQRYDLLSRFYQFKVHKCLDYQEPVLFYHPADWSFGLTAGREKNIAI